MKDEFVSVEHVFLGLMDEPVSTGVGRVNKQHGLTKDKVLGALNEVRGKQRVTSDNPEATYDSLKNTAVILLKRLVPVNLIRLLAVMPRFAVLSVFSLVAQRTTPY